MSLKIFIVAFFAFFSQICLAQYRQASMYSSSSMMMAKACSLQNRLQNLIQEGKAVANQREETSRLLAELQDKGPQTEEIDSALRIEKQKFQEAKEKFSDQKQKNYENFFQQKAQIENKISSLKLELEKLKDERDQAIQELQMGYYCDKCNRSKTQIEKGGENFQEHVKRVSGNIVPASPQQIESLKKEYDQKISSILQEIKKLQDKIQENEKWYRYKEDSLEKTFSMEEIRHKKEIISLQQSKYKKNIKYQQELNSLRKLSEELGRRYRNIHSEIIHLQSKFELAKSDAERARSREQAEQERQKRMEQELQKERKNLEENRKKQEESERQEQEKRILREKEQRRNAEEQILERNRKMEALRKEREERKENRRKEETGRILREKEQRRKEEEQILEKNRKMEALRQYYSQLQQEREKIEQKARQQKELDAQIQRNKQEQEQKLEQERNRMLLETESDISNLSSSEKIEQKRQTLLSNFSQEAQEIATHWEAEEDRNGQSDIPGMEEEYQAKNSLSDAWNSALSRLKSKLRNKGQNLATRFQGISQAILDTVTTLPEQKIPSDDEFEKDAGKLIGPFISPAATLLLKLFGKPIEHENFIDKHIAKPLDDFHDEFLQAE